MNFMYHTVSYSINDVSYICISHFYEFRIKLLQRKFYLSLLVFFNVMFFQASLWFTEHRPFNWNQVETLIHSETLPPRTAAGIRQLSRQTVIPHQHPSLQGTQLGAPKLFKHRSLWNQGYHSSSRHIEFATYTKNQRRTYKGTFWKCSLTEVWYV